MDVYIVRRNTPESRLLSHLGFDRDALPIAEWRGRRRSRGGYGKAPVAWKITGESDIRRLCTGIVRILGAKTDGQRTPEEQKALDRANRTLTAFETRERRAQSAGHARDRRSPALRDLLHRWLPSATQADLESVVATVETATPQSLLELAVLAESVLNKRPIAWSQARAEFIRQLSGSRNA
jgi:hypothetical protein